MEARLLAQRIEKRVDLQLVQAGVLQRSFQPPECFGTIAGMPAELFIGHREALLSVERLSHGGAVITRTD
jgi:hypothetical protein